MGYAGKAELAVFLNELLEAERAGARVTLRSVRVAGAGPIAKLRWTIQRDETRWCAMLIRHLNALGEAPSVKVGAFYGKAMAIADIGERVAFLNRGQGWVVRILREMLRCCRACGMTGWMPISPKCCNRTRRTSPWPTASCARHTERFLDARAGIVEEGEECMVALAFDGRAIRLGQYGLHFLRFQIAWCMDRRFLRRNAQDFGALRDCSRLPYGDKAEEARQSGQPAVASTDRVSAFLLRMAQKSCATSRSDLRRRRREAAS